MSGALLETGEIGKALFLATGDTYMDKHKIEGSPRGRIKGVRQFQTSPAKKGLGEWGHDFPKVDRLYEGETHEPLSKVRARQKMEDKDRWLVSTGFRPSSPPKKQTGPGTFFGAFGGPANIGPPAMPAKGDIPKRPVQPKKNFVTATPKKGSFGMAGTTIAKVPEYVEDPYDAPRLARQKEALAESLRLKEMGKPFVSTCQAAGRMTLDTVEHSATGAPAVFAEDDAVLPRRKFKTDTMTPKQIAEMKEADKGFEKPFVPSAPPKQGYNRTLSKFPDCAPEPYDPKKVRKALLTNRALPTKDRTKNLSAKLAARKVLKPSSGRKAGVTPSIAKMNVSRSTLSLGRRR